jgi:hypothetical protein
MTPEELDWKYIGQRVPKREDTRVRSGHLSQRDFILYAATCQALNRSMASDLNSWIRSQINRWFASRITDIEVLAAQEGVTVEEMICRLVAKSTSTELNEPDPPPESERESVSE